MLVKKVTCHLPGVFYKKPSPDSPPYIEEGAKVKAGDVIGLIEVMKSFHEIKTQESGKLIQYLIEDGSPVSPGQSIADIEI